MLPCSTRLSHHGCRSSLSSLTSTWARLDFPAWNGRGSRYNASSESAQQEVEKAEEHKKPNLPGRSLSVAIVGSGPSGFYTAKYLRSTFDSLNKNETPADDTLRSLLSIDILERLPTPYGLVRSGVAPDHPEVKNVQNDFASLFRNTNDKTSKEDRPSLAQDTPHLSFMGNVNVGTDVSLQELLHLYDAVVLAYGCDSDKKLGLEGEDSLKGIFSARQFVAWYNGHPDYVHLSQPISDALNNEHNNKTSKKQVIVIGQGNVALDCARILAKGGNAESDLQDTDIASHALHVLEKVEGGVDVVTVLGRRGHVQAAFTIKELRELTKLKKENNTNENPTNNNADLGASFVVYQDDLEGGMTASSETELSPKFPGSRPKKRMDQLLRKHAVEWEPEQDTRKSNENARKVVIRFLLSPTKFLPDPQDSARVGAVQCEETELVGPPGKQTARGTGRFRVFEANMVLVSIGYRGIALPGLEACFDAQRGTLYNQHGKVLGSLGNEDGAQYNDCKKKEDGLPRYGLYVSGWLKRGPTGIIGTNIADAKDTVETLLADYQMGHIGSDHDGNFNVGKERKEKNGKSYLGIARPRGREGLLSLLKERGIRVLSWDAYGKIDAHEKDPKRLRTALQPREKLVNVEEMLKVAFPLE